MEKYQFDGDEEEINDLHYEFSVGYDDELPTTNMSYRPVFSYKYLCLEGDYSFHREEFKIKEWKKYLEIVKEFSAKPLEELVDLSNHKYHFKLKTHFDSEHSELAKHMKMPIKRKDPPILGHFALYTTPENPNKPTEKVLSPRIFFLLGKQSVIHILFFDPYHEMHKKKS